MKLKLIDNVFYLFGEGKQSEGFLYNTFTKKAEKYFSTCPFEAKGLDHIYASSVRIDDSVPLINTDEQFVYYDGYMTLDKLRASYEVRQNTPVDINKLALLEYPVEMFKQSEGCMDDMNLGERETFIKGLKVNADKSFTKKEMDTAIEIIHSLMVAEPDSIERADKFVKSISKELSKVTEWNVEIETDIVPDFESRSRDNDGAIFNGLRKSVPTISNDGFIKILSVKHSS